MNIQKESCHKRSNLLFIPSETAKKLYYYVQWTGHFICKDDFYINRTYLDSFLLLYTVSGSGILKTGGTEYQIKTGDLIFLNCRLPHEYFPAIDGWNFRYIHFNGPEAMPLYDYAHTYRGTVLSKCDRILPLFERVYSAVKSSEAEEDISALIYKILMNITKVPSDRESNDILKCALAYITENYNRQIGVDDVSSALHLSRAYFSTEFKRRSGIAPRKYLESYRMEIAKKLLESTSDSVSDIAANCGYTDDVSFIRAFKRTQGTTPYKYRKSED